MLNNFKVIIVGGGPVGLSAAHALRLAGIDFLVLERRPGIFEDAGACIAIAAHSLRIMHQFGVLDSLRAIGEETTVALRNDSHGSPPQSKLPSNGGRVSTLRFREAALLKGPSLLLWNCKERITIVDAILRWTRDDASGSLTLMGKISFPQSYPA